ncbi:MAG: response regulator transcription factor [Flavobacteriales bacterium]|nr:response regulator transcription factor [Flavobacteriales bacterium]
MSSKILLVEDEESLLNVIRMNLELEQYHVDTCSDGELALKMAKEGNYDLILLDVMLPKMDGFEICTQLRKTGNVSPILFLTARGTSEDRINGLKRGADDYLVKPFHLEELLLRIKILLNRNKKSITQEEREEVFSFGNFKIDFNTFEIFENGNKKTELGKREIQLLKLLIQHPGKVISREEILDKIWGEDAYPTSRTIDNYILVFRKNFESNPKEPRYFHSVRGVGYKFTP